MEHGETGGGTGFNDNEPDGIENHEKEMNSAEAGAETGVERAIRDVISKQNEADTDNEVDKTRADIEQPITMVDGKNTPF